MVTMATPAKNVCHILQLLYCTYFSVHIMTFKLKYLIEDDRNVQWRAASRTVASFLRSRSPESLRAAMRVSQLTG